MTPPSLDAHFPGQLFDCVSTHFVTGFVPMRVLAPKIWDRLEEGGYWSIVGGTKEAYPTLQKKADSWVVRKLCGLGKTKVDDLIQNPAKHRRRRQDAPGQRLRNLRGRNLRTGPGVQGLRRIHGIRLHGRLVDADHRIDRPAKIRRLHACAGC